MCPLFNFDIAVSTALEITLQAPCKQPGFNLIIQELISVTVWQLITDERIRV